MPGGLQAFEILEGPAMFWAARALPSGVRGPVEWDALARLAASCFSETGFLGLDIVYLRPKK
jgi:hypothetical protein